MIYLVYFEIHVKVKKAEKRKKEEEEEEEKCSRGRASTGRAHSDSSSCTEPSLRLVISET